MLSQIMLKDSKEKVDFFFFPIFVFQDKQSYFIYYVF